MEYSFRMPVTVYAKRNCIQVHKDIFPSLGKKAILITGRHSAKACGALGDVTSVLESLGIESVLFDQIENNPSVEVVEDASKLAKEFGAEFVVGIGGGSPLDAAKAVAVLAANEFDAYELFTNQFSKALPIVAIPTTAGTGSEATPYSVLLRKDLQTKVSFGNDVTFPKYALLDVKYTTSLSETTTIHTAIDAFTHCFEGYLCNRANLMSDALAMDAMRVFGECLPALLKREFSDAIREKLLYVSFIGGAVIANTGVTIAHGMGYCYTYFKGIPHGMANGLLMKPYLRYIYDEKKDKVDYCMKMLGCKDVTTFINQLEQLIGKAPELTEEEIQEYASLTKMHKGSMSNTAVHVTEDTLLTLWEMAAGRK